ncbi:hypothetical protein GWI33_004171 [Rhynchophorus ferrugineus]|uniref:Uncharacterized protein n=1 Tax=Rhynchophorus ferrugineus TaxID=354439 RepID=A0A834LWQ3_RHYFE|nr:hypothetical protein GWI33_004173 [Rhynchophorus ferrugineus]KAF7262736.1 hypothetical protein GWI33_004171 [Rhynchophorus ferrugineus]
MASINRLSLIKFFELALAVACLGLHHKVVSGDWNVDTLSAATFGGYIIILLGGAAGSLMSASAAGALNIKHFENQWKSEARDYGLAKGSLAVINGVFFLLDTLVTWRGDF